MFHPLLESIGECVCVSCMIVLAIAGTAVLLKKTWQELFGRKTTQEVYTRHVGTASDDPNLWRQSEPVKIPPNPPFSMSAVVTPVEKKEPEAEQIECGKCHKIIESPCLEINDGVETYQCEHCGTLVSMSGQA